MFIESLIRLAEIIDHYESNKQVLISDKFHKETVELIKYQSDFLVSELKFKQDNPGPYSFGFGDFEITIFSPDHTEKQEWAAISRKGNEQKNYRFNSITGLIKVLIMAIEDGNTNRQTKEGSSEA